MSFLKMFTISSLSIMFCQGQDADLKHQFDFWIGDWDVFSNETLVGHNQIVPILDGMVLQENWAGAQGSKGSSFNFFNTKTKKWQQFWVWKNGTTLELEGHYSDKKMILEGKGEDAQGNLIYNKITWFNNDDMTVRQLWETSVDKKTWKVAFDGLYKKVK